MKAKVYVFMPARNEESNLRKSIPNLLSQTVKPMKIFVVNDGSNDKTEFVLNHYCFMTKGIVDFVSLPYHRESYVVNPLLNWKMATVLNHAFLSNLEEYDFLMQTSSDILLPKDYIEKIIRIMQKDRKLVVASGIVEGEATLKSHVRGVGRVYKASFWTDHIRKFPENYTYESYPLYKARALGLEVASFSSIVMKAQRKTRFYKAHYGFAMRELGYFPPFALGRCLLAMLKGKGVSLLQSYIFSPYREVSDEQVKDWLRKRQVERILHFRESLGVWLSRI